MQQSALSMADRCHSTGAAWIVVDIDRLFEDTALKPAQLSEEMPMNATTDNVFL